ncbi:MULTISPECIES: hypothetical protein [unclassified Streptomyces]|uniref:hypothetical protein n=1 Tax=unclassified Streptomyces TaxID=2593676 RepID=UPI003C7C32A9
MEQLDLLDASADGDVHVAPTGVSEAHGLTLTPKRPAVEKAGAADAFPYYAGFSFDWACNRLQLMNDTSKRVLDPWNGSGTTTLAAQAMGMHSVGVDLNPVANKVAQLRSRLNHHTPIIRAPRERTQPVEQIDGLGSWFTDSTVARIRDWTEHLKKVPAEESALAFIAIFRAVRKVTKSFEGSNPTWVKRAKSKDELVSIDPCELDALIFREQEFLAGRLTALPPINTPTAILTASANAIPLRSGSIDAVLTSPPYLTRIDYAVAYARELAVLGVDIAADRTLRARLMGTTLIRNNVDTSSLTAFGDHAQNMLRSISQHKSKASNGYYLKQAVQYLSDLTEGISEISRVCRRGAELHLVVQDSYYKDVPVPLANICVDEALSRGWDLVGAKPYPVKRSLTTLNTSARAYKKGDVAETVISFRKGRNA